MDRFDTLSSPKEETSQEVKFISDLESEHIFMVLQKTGWRVEGKDGAAAMLGINPVHCGPGAQTPVSTVNNDLYSLQL